MIAPIINLEVNSLPFYTVPLHYDPKSAFRSKQKSSPVTVVIIKFFLYNEVSLTNDINTWKPDVRFYLRKKIK